MEKRKGIRKKKKPDLQGIREKPEVVAKKSEVKKVVNAKITTPHKIKAQDKEKNNKQKIKTAVLKKEILTPPPLPKVGANQKEVHKIKNNGDKENKNKDKDKNKIAVKIVKGIKPPVVTKSTSHSAAANNPATNAEKSPPPVAISPKQNSVKSVPVLPTQKTKEEEKKKTVHVSQKIPSQAQIKKNNNQQEDDDVSSQQQFLSNKFLSSWKKSLKDF